MTDTNTPKAEPTMNTWWEIPLWKWREDRDQHATTEEVDYQRQRVYEAEESIGMQRVEQKLFSSIVEIQMYVNMLMKRPYIVRRFGQREIVVHPRMNGAALGNHTSNSLGEMWMPQWAWKESVTLHELAHCLTPRVAGSLHGRRWCYAHMDLVGYMMGREIEKKLKAAYIAYGVKTTPKRPPTVLSPECIAQRSNFYVKPTMVKLPPADDVFPETTHEVVAWIEQHMGFPTGTVKMERVIVPGFFRFIKAPSLSSPIEVRVFRLADLNFKEWLTAFKVPYESQIAG